MLGKWLLTALEGHATDIVILSRDPARFCRAFPLAKAMGVNFIQGDVRSFEFPNETFDYCIHGATTVTSKVLKSDQELEQQSVIVEGTKRVLEFAKITNTRRLLYISSGAVYGMQPTKIKSLPETFPCRPTSVYGKAKLQAEKLCINSPLDCIISRCFAFVGPLIPLNAHFAIGNFVGNCLRNEPIKVKSDGKSLRSFMYSADLIEWLLTMLVGSEKNEIYNVGSHVPISILDLAYLVRNTVGKENLPVIIENNATLSSTAYIPNIEKAIRGLGLDIKINLENAILKTFQSYKV